MGQGRIKLRISDEEIVNAAATSAQSFIDIDVSALRRAIEAAGIDVPELDRLRALLASGQCVDLAKLDDLDLYASPNERDGQHLRDWLIEKAGVKL